MEEAHEADEALEAGTEVVSDAMDEALEEGAESEWMDEALEAVTESKLKVEA